MQIVLGLIQRSLFMIMCSWICWDVIWLFHVNLCFFYGNSIWQATVLKSWRSDEIEHCCGAVRWMEIWTAASGRSEILAPEFSVVVHPMLSLVASYQAGETCLCLLEFFFLYIVLHPSPYVVILYFWICHGKHLLPRAHARCVS